MPAWIDSAWSPIRWTWKSDVVKDPFRVGGIIVTVAIHAAIVGLVLHGRASGAALLPRDFMVAKIVRLGRKRPKNLLPTIPTQPIPTAPKEAIKLTENETGKVTA